MHIPCEKNAHILTDNDHVSLHIAVVAGRSRKSIRGWDRIDRSGVGDIHWNGSSWTRSRRWYCRLGTMDSRRRAHGSWLGSRLCAIALGACAGFRRLMSPWLCWGSRLRRTTILTGRLQACCNCSRRRGRRIGCNDCRSRGAHCSCCIFGIVSLGGCAEYGKAYGGARYRRPGLGNLLSPWGSCAGSDCHKKERLGGFPEEHVTHHAELAIP